MCSFKRFATSNLSQGRQAHTLYESQWGDMFQRCSFKASQSNYLSYLCQSGESPKSVLESGYMFDSSCFAIATEVHYRQEPISETKPFAALFLSWTQTHTHTHKTISFLNLYSHGNSNPIARVEATLQILMGCSCIEIALFQLAFIKHF